MSPSNLIHLDGAVAASSATRGIAANILAGQSVDEQIDPARFRVVIIDGRRFIRDCLTYCLTQPDQGCDVASFSSIGEWRSSNISSADVDTVFVRYATGKHSRKLVVDEMLALCATNERMSTVLISDNDDADEIIGAISDGVKGYIVTSVSLKVAIEAMRLVKAGGTYIPASSLMGGRNLSLCDDGNADSRERFTPRQMAVLEEIKKGKANKLIAYDLNMKESTVKVHVRNIMRKVGATNRTEVAVMSFDYGRSGR